MNVRSYKIERWFGGAVNIYITGDWQLGSVHSSKSGIKAFVDRVASDSSALWLHHGDYMESIPPGDTRYSVLEHEKTIMQQRRTFIDTVAPIAHKCLGVLKGNHEEKLERSIGAFHADTCEYAGVPACDAVVGLTLKTNGKSIKWCAAHGADTYMYDSGSEERNAANTVEKLRRRFRHFAGDVCGVGHAHKVFVAPPTEKFILDYGEGKEVRERWVSVDPRWYYICGSMHKTYIPGHTGYGESWHLPPTQLGWVVMTISEEGDILSIRGEEL